MDSRISLLAVALIAPISPTPAADLTIEPQRFEVSADFDCVAIPIDSHQLVISADEWSQFKIDKVLPHGTAVKKGELLISFENEALTRKLEDTRPGVRAAEIAVANAVTALAAQEQYVPVQLAKVKATHDRAAADLADFRKTRRPASEEKARESLKYVKQRLESAEMELDQLKQMYAADDLTEETEEFILKRQHDVVAAAKFRVRMQELETEHSIKVELPRNDEDLARAVTEAKITLDRFQQEVPRGVESKKLELEAAKRVHERAAADLAQLEKDAANMVVKSPVDGHFYYGVFRNGQWVTGDKVKAIVKGGVIGVDSPFATVVPNAAGLQFAARVEQPAVRGLAVESKGEIKVGGFDELPVPATVTSIAGLPGTDGRFLVSLESKMPEEIALVPGMKGKASIGVYSKEDAILVPEKAVDNSEKAPSVKVRLADGGSETREVKTGRSHNKKIEILEGLEAGQAIEVPE